MTETWFDPVAALREQVQTMAKLVEGADVLRLVAADGTRAGLLRRLDMAERFRLQLGARVAVDADPGQLPDVAGAIAAGKSDLVTRTGTVLDGNVENQS